LAERGEKTIMADRIITILTPATDFDLVTLDEAKMLMGQSLTDTSDDAQLQLFIDINSATAARLCNRVFAREEVREEWRELGCQLSMPGYYYPDYVPYYSGTSLRSDAHRIFLSHWPVQAADIESVESPQGTLLDPSAYEIETLSGKLECLIGSFVEPVVVTYWGGYDLPEEAPFPLKQACALLNAQSKLLAQLGAIGGIRLLSHKQAKVAFHDPLKIIEAAMGGKGSPMQMSVMNILSHYMRLEV
jgi:hypothetical protein